MMSLREMGEWFAALPPFTQIFFGLFLFLVALPIATLIVFQLLESLRLLRSSGKSRNKRD